jgi:hypothetical protein
MLARMRILHALVIAGCALCACKTVDPVCQKQIDACLLRCDPAGNESPPSNELNPQDSQSWCEERCQHCREPAQTKAADPKPSPPPTYTN